ncbi:hypothetical protein [Kribbella sandramycini]|uniref:Uncharacterized protein n=1 Tax=Kribbella sandramycini TaxID=60450 RepID=A0A841S446_9ACTN|nr:hypothetical protein [Kribbella sandramycini]MBB6564440.1 hypothetical protein [Kribbella sandramycini]
MDPGRLYDLAPAFCLAAVAWLVVVSHLWNAATIVDRRRAARKGR